MIIDNYCGRNLLLNKCCSGRNVYNYYDSIEKQKRKLN